MVEIFILVYWKFSYNISFFTWKTSVTDNLFVSFFWGKNQSEPIAIKIHTQKILLMQLNLLSLIRCRKTEWKSSTLVFHHFCRLFLGMWKNVLSFQNFIAIVFHINVFSFYEDYFWMLQFTDSFKSLNHRAYW